MAGGREGLRVRGTGRPGEPARPVRRPPSADRLPRVLRARRARLARARVRRLLDGRRPGRPRRPPERPRHHARVRLARAAGRHRAGEGADGLGDALVHDHRRLRRRLRRRRVARHERVHPRRRPRVPHLLHQRPRRRGARQHLELPRHDRARAPGGVGGLAGGLPADAAVRVVDLARRAAGDRPGSARPRRAPCVDRTSAALARSSRAPVAARPRGRPSAARAGTRATPAGAPGSSRRRGSPRGRR